MINIYAEVYNRLSQLGYPVHRINENAQGFELTETFLAYDIIASPNETHYDNRPHSTTFLIQINFYSEDPSLTQGADAMIQSVMRPGFLRQSGRDLPASPITDHDGYAVDYKYFDMEVLK